MISKTSTTGQLPVVRIKMIKRLTLIFLLFFILWACVPATPTTVSSQQGTHTPTVSPTPRLTQPQLPWWRDAVFYEIFVRSFYDTDGNGIGDFNGITEKLDYLQELGINAIWLMPIHPSPSYHGYDVINYYAVNPEYGTMDDFKHLLQEAHNRGIRIIIDLVLNHTSNQHPFFRDAVNPNSKYHDWYIWSDTNQGNGWHPLQPDGYYFGLFCDCMPDLNYRNPEVTAQMENVVRYWLEDIGVDGFRVDAAKHLIEEGNISENTPETHQWYKNNFYPTYKKARPDAYAVGEVFGAGPSMAKLYTGDQLDQVFNFEMASGFVNSAAGETNAAVDSAITFALHDMPDFNFATFLTNHDQNRVMSMLNGNVDKARVAATLMLTSPGTPFIYYGEEIGMEGRKPDEDIRLPMQWSPNVNAGFTTGTPWRAPAADYQQANVAAENDDSNSLLNHYRELLKLRKEHPALVGGDITLLETGNFGVYAALRSSDNEKILVIVNLKGTTISDYKLSLKDHLLTDGEVTLRSLLGTVDAQPLSIADGKFSEYKPLNELLAYETYVFEIR